VVFRAAFNTGLPIETRQGHSFALGYYKPFGLDATIYLGKQDLQFENNTPGDILIRVVRRSETLVVLFYGTKDRKVEVENTRMDRAASGGWMTSWVRTVARAGMDLKTEVLKSYYQAEPVETVEELNN
jgi:vancomycin resistance protein YoaR